MVASSASIASAVGRLGLAPRTLTANAPAAVRGAARPEARRRGPPSARRRHHRPLWCPPESLGKPDTPRRRPADEDRAVGAAGDHRDGGAAVQEPARCLLSRTEIDDRNACQHLRLQLVEASPDPAPHSSRHVELRRCRIQNESQFALPGRPQPAARRQAESPVARGRRRPHHAPW